MTVPSFINKTENYNYSTTGTSATLTFPGSGQVGDILELTFILSAGPTGFTIPNWGEQYRDWDLISYRTLNGDYQRWVYWIRDYGVALGTGISWTGADNYEWGIRRIRGCKAGNPVERALLNAGTTTGTQPDPAAIPVLSQDALVWVIGSSWRGFIAPSGGITNYTTAFNGNSGAQTGYAHAVAYRTFEHPVSSEDPGAMSNSAAGSDSTDALTIVFASEPIRVEPPPPRPSLVAKFNQTTPPFWPPTIFPRTTVNAVAGPSVLETGLSLETDTSLSLTFTKLVVTGSSDETDVALAPTFTKTLTVGLVEETDAALASTLVKTLTTGLSDEVDVSLAQTLTKTIGAGRADEVDSALGLTFAQPLGAFIAPVVLPGELNRRTPPFWPPTSIPRSSTNPAAALVVVAGRSDEIDSAIATVLVKQVATGLATEASSALATSLVKNVATGFATETDSAFAVALNKELGTGVSLETDTTPDLVVQKLVTIGLGDEVDTALAPVFVKQLTTGLATETDAAVAATLVRSITPQVALETSVAFSCALAKYIAAGLADETNFAFSLFDPTQNLATGLSSETEAALSAGLQKYLTGGLSSTTETAFSLQLQKILGVGGADEADSAPPLSFIHPIATGLATDQSTAFGLVLIKQMMPKLAVEFDVAFSTLYVPPPPELVGPPTVIVGAPGPRLMLQFRKGPKILGS